MDNVEANIKPSSEAAHNKMATVLHRLTAVLTQENEILSSTVEADHANYIIAKNQALRELIVMHRAQQQSPYTPELLQHLCEVRKLIDRNSQLLKLQLSTLNALTSFVTQTLMLYKAGMDDVVRKPVHAKELIARFDAIKRRGTESHSSLWSVDGLIVYGDGRSPEVNGRSLTLPRRERRILQCLATNKGRRVTRAQIFSAIYGLLDDNVEECVVESHISKLRKKIRAVIGYDPIDTQRFLGYQLVGREVAAA